MAKVTFTKLALKKKEEVKNIKINDIDIEVKQYLPVNDKLDLNNFIDGEINAKSLTFVGTNSYWVNKYDY